LLKLRKLKDFNRDNRFVLIVNFHNRFDKALRKKKFVMQGLTSNVESCSSFRCLKSSDSKELWRSSWNHFGRIRNSLFLPEKKCSNTSVTSSSSPFSQSWRTFSWTNLLMNSCKFFPIYILYHSWKLNLHF